MVVVNCLDFILSEEEEEQTNKCQTTSSSSHLLLLLQQQLKLRLFKSFKSWKYAITTNNNNNNTDNNNNNNNTDTQPPFTPIEIISEIEHRPIANLCDIKISYNCQALIVSDFRWGKIHMFDLLTRKYLKPIYHYSAIPRTLPLCMCVEEESSPMNRFRANSDTQNYLIFTTHSENSPFIIQNNNWE